MYSNRSKNKYQNGYVTFDKNRGKARALEFCRCNFKDGLRPVNIMEMGSHTKKTILLEKSDENHKLIQCRALNAGQSIGKTNIMGR